MIVDSPSQMQNNLLQMLGPCDFDYAPSNTTPILYRTTISHVGEK